MSIEASRNGRGVSLGPALARLRIRLAEHGSAQQLAVGGRSLALQDMVERCATHGPWKPYVTSEEGGTVLRAFPMCPACRRERALHAFAKHSQTPLAFASATFENYERSGARQKATVQEIQTYAQSMAERRSSGGLILFGDHGTGKTHLSIALLRECQSRGLSGYYVRAIDLMNRLRQSSSPGAGSEDRNVIDRLAAVDVLVVDDVGKSLGTDFERSAFYNLIDTRSGELRPTVLTTNVEMEALRDLLTPAGYDRITDAGSNIVRLDWPSHRRMRLAHS